MFASASVLPRVPQGTQFITGVCARDADCASDCCGFNTGKCAGPVIAQDRDGGCGFGDGVPNNRAAQVIQGPNASAAPGVPKNGGAPPPPPAAAPPPPGKNCHPFPSRSHTHHVFIQQTALANLRALSSSLESALATLTVLQIAVASIPESAQALSSHNNEMVDVALEMVSQTTAPLK